jgi:glycosyltransferase involved in cell wall biosynthesis
MAERGIDTQVVVVSTGKRNALITELHDDVDVRLLEGGTLRRLLLLRTLTKGRLVHIHFGDGRIHSLVRFALLRRKLLVTYHSVYRHKRNWLKNRLDQFWATKASSVIGVSDAVRDFCATDVGIPHSKISVIPNGIPVPTSKISSNVSPVDFVAVSLASLYPHKNHGVLLDALSIAKQAGLPVKLKIIGDGPMMAPYFRQTLNLQLRADVEWYGAIWRRDLVEPVLASANVFVSSSRYEGAPLSILEAMTFGLPLILSDIPSHREIAAGAAWYFPADQPMALARLLVRLFESQASQHELRALSLDRSNDFDLEQTVDQYVNLYRSSVS